MRSIVLSAAVSLVTAIAHAQYAPAVPPTSGVLGYWSTNAGSVLRAENCGAYVCIKIMTISQKAPGVIDGHNPDPALRTRPVCKMDIGTNFKLQDADHGEDGRIYDPASGKTYKSAITSTGNTLSVRGYIGFKAIGRSETWKRTSAEYATCVGTSHR